MGQCCYAQQEAPAETVEPEPTLALDAELLETVSLEPNDLQPSDHAALIAGLDRTRRIERRVAEAAAADFFRTRRSETGPLPDLLKNPEAYHGQLVTLEGQVRRIAIRSINAEQFGINQLYDVWLYVDGGDVPVLIVCAELQPSLKARFPENASEINDVINDVRATGFFLKRVKFGDDQVAPLLATHQPRWIPQVRDPSDPKIEPFVLAPVQLGPSTLKAVENHAYYYLLEKARKTDSSVLDKAAADFYTKRQDARQQQRKRRMPPFIDVFKHRDEYHGQPVMFKGRVRRLVPYTAPENDYGIETLYDLWIYTDDSQNNAAVVVCTDLPEGLKTQMGSDILIDNVAVTGYFFKMMAYQAQDTAHMTPMLIAKKPTWKPVVGGTEPVLPKSVVNILAGLGLVGIVVGFWFVVVRDDRKGRVKTVQEEASFADNEDAKDQVSPEFPSSADGNASLNSTAVKVQQCLTRAKRN
ncbi:MAG: hypothetical protein CMJ78_14215 [Planctomycetaceae bacterium]|nr:hypothetical protein [Planctomycetaceae bacterium]